MTARRRLAARLALATSLALAAPPAALAEAHRKAGLWEVTATTEVQGTALALPPVSQTECLSQQEVDADPVETLDKGACRATDIRRERGRVTWKLVCSGTLEGKGQGEIVYESPTAYRGSLTLQASGTTVKVTLRARRVGGC